MYTDVTLRAAFVDIVREAVGEMVNHRVERFGAGDFSHVGFDRGYRLRKEEEKAKAEEILNSLI